MYGVQPNKVVLSFFSKSNTFYLWLTMAQASYVRDGHHGSSISQRAPTPACSACLVPVILFAGK